MESEIGGSFFGPALPGVKRFQQRLAGAWDHKVDDGCRAARHGRGGAGVEIFAGHRAHKRHLHMGVGVDTAGHHQLVAGIDNLAAFRHV